MIFNVEFWYQNVHYRAEVYYDINEDTFDVQSLLDWDGNSPTNCYLEDIALEEAKEALWEYIKKCKEEDENDEND